MLSRQVSGPVGNVPPEQPTQAAPAPRSSPPTGPVFLNPKKGSVEGEAWPPESLRADSWAPTSIRVTTDMAGRHGSVRGPCFPMLVPPVATDRDAAGGFPFMKISGAACQRRVSVAGANANIVSRGRLDIARSPTGQRPTVSTSPLRAWGASRVGNPATADRCFRIVHPGDAGPGGSLQAPKVHEVARSISLPFCLRPAGVQERQHVVHASGHASHSGNAARIEQRTSREHCAEVTARRDGHSLRSSTLPVRKGEGNMATAALALIVCRVPCGPLFPSPWGRN
jgi:hypothetical protein